MFKRYKFVYGSQDQFVRMFATLRGALRFRAWWQENINNGKLLVKSPYFVVDDKWIEIKF